MGLAISLTDVVKTVLAAVTFQDGAGNTIPAPAGTTYAFTATANPTTAPAIAFAANPADATGASDIGTFASAPPVGAVYTIGVTATVPGATPLALTDSVVATVATSGPAGITLTVTQAS